MAESNDPRLAFWLDRMRGGDPLYEVTEQTIAENVREALGACVEQPEVDVAIRDFAREALSGSNVKKILGEAQDMAIAWLKDCNRADLIEVVAAVGIHQTTTDEPVAQMTYLDAAGDITLDVGLIGAISRSSKVLQALWGSPPVRESDRKVLFDVQQQVLSSERIHALARLDAAYWQVLRWHGLFAVHFQFRQTESTFFSLCADWVGVTFAVLHELAHVISRADNYQGDANSCELEADQLAAHILRHSVGPEMAALGASLYVYVVRRATESIFIIPPNSHPHWLCRQSEIEVALGWSLHENVRRAIEPVSLLHDFSSIHLGGLTGDVSPINSCFDLWDEVIARPSVARIEAMERLADLDAAFRAAPLMGYAIAARESLLQSGQDIPPFGEIDQTGILELVRLGRGNLRTWLRDNVSVLQTGAGLTYRSLACPEQEMSDSLRGVRARYAANRLAASLPGTDW